MILPVSIGFIRPTGGYALTGLPARLEDDSRGFLMLTGLFILASLLTLCAVSLSRSVLNLAHQQLMMARQQALQTAEAGLEIAMSEEQWAQAPWTWTTHQVVYDTQRNPIPGASVAAPNGTPTIPQATIDETGYHLMIGVNQVTVQVLPSAFAASCWVLSRGQSAATQQQVIALVQPKRLSEYFLYTSDRVRLNSGQRARYDAGNGQAGEGRIYINGFLQLSTGTGSYPKYKQFIVRDLMVNGEIFETFGTEGIYFQTPAKPILTPPNNANFMPNSRSGGRFFYSMQGTLENPLDPNSPHNYGTASPNPAWSTFLDQSQVRERDGTLGENLTPHVKELFSGSVPPNVVPPNLTIDEFVLAFRPVADRVIRNPGEVPCGAGSEPQTATNMFANPLTLRSVRTIDIDMNALTACAALPPQAVLYVEAPVRLINGATVFKDVTIVSPDAVYIRGNFNQINPKSVSVVTGNRAYFLSQDFKEYLKAVDKYPDGTTITDPVKRVTEQNKYHNSGGSTYGRSGFQSLFQPGGDTTTYLPPVAEWRDYVAPETHQHVMVVAPTQRWGDDRMLDQKWNYPEPWARDSFGNDRHTIYMDGGFIELKDSDVTHAAYYANFPYSDGNPVPQDDLPIPYPNNDHIFLEPILYSSYDTDLYINPPPGFGKVERGWTGRVKYWRQQ